MMSAACRRMRSCCVTFVISAVVWCLSSGIAGSQTTEESRFRRILAPHNALESQINGLLPMKRDEFESKVRVGPPRCFFSRSRRDAYRKRAIHRPAEWRRA